MECAKIKDINLQLACTVTAAWSVQFIVLYTSPNYFDHYSADMHVIATDGRMEIALFTRYINHDQL